VVRVARALALSAITCLVAGLRCFAGGEASAQSDVPMTRPDECLAVHDGIGLKATFANLADGTVLAWTQGRFHASKDGGLTFPDSWEPQRADTKGRISWGQPSLILLKDGAVGLLADVTPPPSGEYEKRIAALGPRPDAKTDPVGERQYRQTIKEMRKDVDAANKRYLAFWRSADGGKTWSQPRRVSPVENFNQMPLNHVAVRAMSGRILFPVYGQGYVYVYRSDDDGATWQRSRDYVRSYYRYQGRSRILDEDEPCIVEVKPGSFLMLMRTDVGRLYESWSHDNGDTWTDGVPTELMSNNSPAQVAMIPGTTDLVVVFNQGNTAEARKELYRSRLSTAISRDGGRTWSSFQNIESSLEGTYIAPEPLNPEWTLAGLNLRNDELPGLGKKPPVTDKTAKGRLHGVFTYPAILFSKGNFLVGHADLHWDAQRKYHAVGRTRVVPISWLYGGPNRKANPAVAKGGS